MSWETMVNTGNHEQDRAAIEHYRQQANAYGMDLDVQPVPTGGYYLRGVPRAAAQQPQAWGGQPGYGQAAQGAYGYAQQAGYGQPAQPTPAYAQAAASGPNWNAPATPAAQPVARAAGAVAVLGAQTGVPAGTLGAERVAYLRKVYGLLAGSCALAIFCAFAMLYLLPTETFVYRGKEYELSLAVVEMASNPMLLGISFAVLFGATIIASWTSRIKGVNVAMLFLVGALMGIQLAPMVMVANILAGAGQSLSTAPVRDAFMMVGAVFGGITAYVFITRKDFSYLGASLGMGVLVILTAGILAIFLGSEIFTLAYASAGAVLAGGFLLYQTSQVLHGDMSDPVEDALVFLVQLRNLFMFLLRIFMSSRR